jgi:acyl carrier protein
MDKQQMRLVECFSRVFPELSTEEITEATSTSVEAWDSVSGVTLFVEVEEEFGISIEVDDLARFNSFDGFMSYLQEIESNKEVTCGGSNVMLPNT